MHLTDDTFARLASDPHLFSATDSERAHLDECEACRRILSSYREQHRRLASLSGGAGPAPWATIERRLREEGLITDRSTGRLMGLTRQVAAAVAILAVGLVTGMAIGRSASYRAPARVAATADTTNPATELERAQAAYRSALVRLIAAQPLENASTRLAMLQAIVLTTGAAQREAPDDPIINIYHAAALDQRNAVLGSATKRLPAKGEPWF